tara:strand:- start:156 stop:524 length:369 start_codon:yes stop_codon:yes gene_type:complete
MKNFVPLVVALSFIPFAAVAEEERGLSLMERGARLFMQGILKEMEPAIDEFEGFADQMGPALKNFAIEMGPKLTELLDQVDDWSAYTAPEMLPNGDIIMRRKPDHPLAPPDTPTEPAPQIEL